MVVFRLASSEESRLVESFQGLVSKLNAMALSKFQKDIDAVKVAVTRHRGLRSDPEHFYENLFLRKVRVKGRDEERGKGGRGGERGE